jgi:prepilin-type N-terminal cleavage/methylation domain-containing protein
MLKNNLNKNSGFTLLELMIALLIFGILMSFGLPAYKEFSARKSIANETNNLLGDIAFARVTAINLGQSIVIEPNDATNWNDGWSIYVDKDSSFDFDDQDEMLRIKDNASRGITIEGPSSLAFDNLGVLTDLASVSPKSILIKHENIDHINNIDIALSGLAMTNN